ncbi:DinB family protein [Streptomyces sp. ICBB 8177]|uniref:DinB family protein n=1 Tax=Streptomyces sp. ICBB 8177 TaxID=563922 RepID=UPI000D67E9AC|nr:DinB family protein [Streptomyces sp. ICBB 8177]PWI43531.1 hypothetical protein CK485_15495 [Streptomyces sp. ICBB 8177]
MVTFVGEGNDERETLLMFVAEQRDAVIRAAFGLTDEQAAARPTKSELSVAGLIKHCTEVERQWIVGILSGRPQDLVARDESNWHDSFRMVGDETLADLVSAYRAAGQETEELVRALPDLEVAVALPDLPWFPPGAKRSARWILAHLIQETGRHAGHADILRESLDGGTSFALIAAERQAREADGRGTAAS